MKRAIIAGLIMIFCVGCASAPSNPAPTLTPAAEPEIVQEAVEEEELMSNDISEAESVEEEQQEPEPTPEPEIEEVTVV